ncbi:metallophosphoesterase [Candidatus Peribacteria bacterium]|jgi:uncharacterized protein|nr:metallophosphoesterase [Candidatus Peribacteria bacterium]MBT4021137.1 metallophosphoesterase [Candidatus Peribacteria bacterium]MBT4240869.1 metallophosphoesterase [Candidatus Peribacteria bacterium]MBT4474653.1 metallophosphoesterase [Candidatus Peribacteria bacterium]
MFTYIRYALAWEIATLALIVGGIYLCFWGYKKRKMLFVAIGIVISITVLYGSFVEPRIITITEAEIDLPIEEELKIVVLSDFEIGLYKGKKFVERVVERVNKLEPDIVLIAGDFIFIKSEPGDSFLPLLDLSPKYGVYGVLGNHAYSCYDGNITRKKHVGFDLSLIVRRAVERAGVKILRNEWEAITLEGSTGLSSTERQGASGEVSGETEGLPLDIRDGRMLEESKKGNKKLYIAGVNDACTGRDDLELALPKPQQKSAIILMAHDPSVILDDKIKYAHLIVSGHTHGGQIRLPFIGPLISLPTQLGRKYDQGLFAIDKDTNLFISRGLGESGARARLFAPPEIVLLNTK